MAAGEISQIGDIRAYPSWCCTIPIEQNIQFFPEEVGTQLASQTRPSEGSVPRDERGQD
jgi:hypothetical protein